MPGLGLMGMVVRGCVGSKIEIPESEHQNQRQKANDMAVKAQLVTNIADLIRERGLTQEGGATLLGLTQPKVSNLLKGQFRGVSERLLLRCLTKLGRDVEIMVKPAPPRRAGRLTLLFNAGAR
ncbi:MAG: helix-turn-helix transcriptional regulator [Acidobacteriota bacterium]|nr:helix-turn-helix transcriptional regulator [Acidobacteriota bacterium]